MMTAGEDATMNADKVPVYSPESEQQQQQQQQDYQASSPEQTDDDLSCPSSSSGASRSSVLSHTEHSVSTYAHNKMARKESNSFDVAQRESQALVIWRLVIVSAIVLITIGASIAVFVYVDSKEFDNFLFNFEEDSFKIFSDLGKGIVQRFAQLDTLALSMVSYVNATDSSSIQWPFVTVPNFAVRASKARSTVGAVAMETFYYIPEDDDVNSTRKEWEQYTMKNGIAWMEEALAVQEMDEAYEGQKLPDNEIVLKHNDIWYGKEAMPENSGPYTPSWQAYPIAPASGSVYNWNAIMDPLLGPGLEYAFQQKEAVLTQALNLARENESSHIQYAAEQTAEWAAALSSLNVNPEEPLVRLIYPVLSSALSVPESASAPATDSEVTAVVASSFYFGTLLRGILPTGQDGLVVVVNNECGMSFTYELNGAQPTYLGEGDLHDKQYDSYALSVNFTELSEFVIGGDLQTYYQGLPIATSYCLYNVTIFPSEVMETKYRSNDPIIFTYSVIAIFLVTSICFLGYDKLVADRQQKVLRSAQQSNAIISSLFPSNIRDRLFVDGAHGGEEIFQPNKARLRNFLHDEEDQSASEGGATGAIKSRPIADLFTDCTVMFADIANFTAWSSVREPGQVFTLLETLYGAFDQIAAKRGVFKVETIGDSYVAVAGLPEPRPDHAIVMIKFSRDCRQKCIDICGQLEVSLGPDTGDLRMRFGLNSGPVTAGVLRGEKSRFQLFGDTVNTAARMESHCLIGRIQVSQTTADLLIEGRKDHWLEAREDKVEAKGKGLMQTYWVEPGGKFAKAPELVTAKIDFKTERLVNWNVVVLSRMLLQIINRREQHRPRGRPSVTKNSVVWSNPERKVVLGEVKEIIELPEFSAVSSPQKMSLEDIDGVIKDQLYDYVAAIALIYHNNPFHNFEHASHVCMSVAKLLSRITAADEVYDTETGDTRQLASNLHNYTYGITSDPLTSFACVFSALIHDCDHPGVPNTQLVKEETDMAQTYEGKSVAEQNSVNMAWGLLLQDQYADLRAAICETPAEEKRFRQLVVNAVMATDIMDKDLKKLRDDRWSKAFTEDSGLIETLINQNEGEAKDTVNRKATIVIEHIIQASDVAHTMQHWHIYRKWNERLFREMHKAYLDGRAEKDPADFWYQGEIGFFDFYIIPLAKKLSECGVFGVSSDEYLNYALMNRNEWEKKGMGIVEEMLDKMAQEVGVSPLPAQERGGQSTDSTKDSSQEGQ